MKVNHRSRKPGIMIINIRLNRMLTWHIVLSLNGERALSMYSIYVDHIIQHSGIYSIWILEHLKILIKFLMEKIIALRHRFIFFWKLGWELETPTLGGKNQHLPNQLFSQINSMEKINLLPMQESIHFSILWLIENTLLLLFAILKIMLACIDSHLDFPKEIVISILYFFIANPPTHVHMKWARTNLLSCNL